MAHLTDVSIRSLRPRSSQYEVRDDDLPGFGVRIGTKGKISFVVSYSVHGRRKRDTLGRYPIISLAEARKLARHRLASIILNSKSPDYSTSMTFSEAVEAFFEMHCARRNRPSTATETKRQMQKYWLPAFGRRLLPDISTREISLIVDRKRRSAESEARHAFSVIRKFFNWARQQRLVMHSPCEGLEFGFRMISRTRVLSDDELVAVYRAAEIMGYPYGRIVQLLILTGQRRGEITGLARSFINEENRTITLPAWLVKNNREHTFAYGDMVADILASIPDQGDLLFPARGFEDRSYTGWNKGKQGLDRLAQVKFKVHDLRRTWASHSADLEVNPWVIEAHLNHASGTVSGIAAVYNRYKYLKETRVAVERFEDKLKGLLAKSKLEECPVRRRALAHFHIPSLT